MHLKKAGELIRKRRSITAAVPNFEHIVTVMEGVDRWLGSVLTGEELREAKDEFKDAVFTTLKSSNIRDEYYELLCGLASHLTN